MIAILRWLLISAVVLGARSQVVDQTIAPNCTVVIPKDDIQRAYLGWPFKIDCTWFTGELLEDEYSLYELYDYAGLLYDEEVVCVIDNGNFSTNNTLTLSDILDDYGGSLEGVFLPDLQEGDPVDYEMTLYVPRINRCLSMSIHLQLFPFPNETCQEYVASLASGDHSTDIGTNLNFNCDVESKDYPKLPHYFQQTLTHVWQRNCTDLVETGVAVRNRLLNIGSVEFNHAGIYTCAVTYNGMTRYITSKQVCVHRPLTANKHTLSCTKTVLQTNLGNSALFNCEGNFGTGQISQGQFKFVWQKLMLNGNYSNLNPCQSTNDDSNSPVSCTYKQPDKFCFLHIVNRTEIIDAEAIVPLQLSFNNVEESDYGRYRLIAQSNLRGSVAQSVELILEPDVIPGLLTKASVAGICIGLIAAALIVFLFVAYNSLYFRVKVFRRFLPVTPDNRCYGAFLTYHYARDLDKFAQHGVKEAVVMVREVLEGLGYKVYDEKRDAFSGEGRAESIRASVEQSHRIVILLTLDYIKDDWSVLTLQKGFDDMIRSGSKLIFVMVPGIKEYLKQHSINDSTCEMIQRAIKTNYAIQWSSDKKFNQKKFRMKIHDAMPKLASQKSRRSMSTSSNGNLSFIDYKGVGFQRCFSNETETTELDFPRTNGEVLQMIEEQPSDPRNSSV